MPVSLESWDTNEMGEANAGDQAGGTSVAWAAGVFVDSADLGIPCLALGAMWWVLRRKALPSLYPVPCSVLSARRPTRGHTLSPSLCGLPGPMVTQHASLPSRLVLPPPGQAL